MKERLTTRLDGYAYGKCGVDEKTALKSKRWHRGSFECTALIEKLAEYEDLEEQGLIVRLPCKIGDKFWYISGKLEIVEEAVFELSTNGKVWGAYDSMSDWHLIKNLFFTRAEAEKKLKELKGEE